MRRDTSAWMCWWDFGSVYERRVNMPPCLKHPSAHVLLGWQTDGVSFNCRVDWWCGRMMKKVLLVSWRVAEVSVCVECAVPIGALQGLRTNIRKRGRSVMLHQMSSTEGGWW